MYRSITLVGALTGQMWMGGTGFLPINEDVLAMRRRIVGIAPRTRIADVVDSIITERGGDFQDTKLSGDSYIVIEHSRSILGGTQRKAIRYVDVTKLPSLAEYVDVDAIMPDEIYGWGT